MALLTEGRRVDYALSTQAGLLSAPSYWDDVLSDHKVYMVSLHLGYEEAFNEYMVPTSSYLKPDGVSSDVWRKTIARHWQHAMPSLLPLRRRRSGILSMRRPRSVCAVQLWSMVVASLKTGGPRAQRHGPVPAIDYNCRAGNLSTFSARSTLKLLGRIREYWRRILLDKEDPALLHNICRTWPKCAQFGSWSQAEQRLQGKLGTMQLATVEG